MTLRSPSLIILKIVILFLFPYFAHSVRFSTSYLSLEIPKNWKCISEGANWVCHNKLTRKLAREAVIILTAKEKGNQDSVNNYVNYLKQRKTITSRKNKNKKILSKVFHSKQRHIKTHLWADGFHLESELQHYYTRYLGSTKKSLAVLVTYSAHKKLWKKYAADFNKSIESLQLLNVDQALRKIRASKGGSGQGLRDYIDALIGDGDIDVEEDDDGLDLFGEHKGKVIGGTAGALSLGAILYRMLMRRGRRKNTVLSSRRRRRR